MSKRTYTCDHCGEECMSSWDDEHAVAEYERAYGKPYDPSQVAEVCDDCYRLLRAYQKTEVESDMDQKHNIDPDGTPASKFINDLMIKILQETPNPEDQPAPDEQQRGHIIMGALVSLNAGVIANVISTPGNREVVMQVVMQLASEVFEEVARLQPQVTASRGMKQ